MKWWMPLLLLNGFVLVSAFSLCEISAIADEKDRKVYEEYKKLSERRVKVYEH